MIQNTVADELYYLQFCKAVICDGKDKAQGPDSEKRLGQNLDT